MTSLVSGHDLNVFLQQTPGQQKGRAEEGGRDALRVNGSDNPWSDWFCSRRQIEELKVKGSAVQLESFVG